MTGAATLAAAVRSGETAAAGLVYESLARLRGLDDQLGAFLWVAGAVAQRQAEALDAAAERRGGLCGVPVAVKDNIAVAGQPTTCGSRMLKDWRAPYDAEAVTRLRRAGAIIVGKTNLDEFAMGSSGEHSAFGPTLNPWDLERVPGGSSSGSAAAVAAGIVPIALGSDTGGSVRQPASYCGLVAIKPTYGRVSRRGLVAFASSLDQIGVMARSVADARLALRAIAGHDPGDATSSKAAGDWEAPATPKRVGVPWALVERGVDSEVVDALQATARALEESGITIQPVELPSSEVAVATYTVLAAAEAASNLARYDGVRFGQRQGGDTSGAMTEATRSAGFGAEVKRRILIGTYVLRAGYYDAYYRQALAARARFRAAFQQALGAVDAILMPTAPTVAFRLGEKTGDPLSMYSSDVFTVSANLAGVPAMAVPAGFSSHRMPIGVQLLGRPFEEDLLCTLARRIEEAFPDLQSRRPAAFGESS